jgi:hypothetical protein
MKNRKTSAYNLNKMGYLACKKWAKKFYKTIGIVLSPALDNQYVSFNNTGFTHLIRKMSLRSRNEQKRRFLLLPKVESIIKNPKALIVYRKEEKKILIKKKEAKILKESIVHYWTFVCFTDSKRIKVVIRQINNGSKHFYSIMDKKVDKQKTRL